GYALPEAGGGRISRVFMGSLPPPGDGEVPEGTPSWRMEAIQEHTLFDCRLPVRRIPRPDTATPTMIKSFFVYLPSTFLMRASSFLTMIAGTHLLAPKQFGYLSLVFLIGEFVETTTTGWTRLVLTRFGARDTKRLPRSLAAKVARLSAVCALFG